LAGAAAYIAVCVMVASVAWVAVGTVAAKNADVTPSPIAAVQSPTNSAVATQSPNAVPTDTPGSTMTPWPDASQTATPTPGFFQIDLYKDGTFVSQITKYSCMAAAIQNMLNIIGPKAKIDLSSAKQIQISQLLISLTTKSDSKNGGYGPLGWALTLGKLGAGKYKLLVDNSLNAAMHDAAVALRKTGRPVGLLTWWGAHSWVMTGFQSDVDPRTNPTTFSVVGAYIVDPFFPRHSSIWGQTVGPDILRDMPTMTHNYIGWKRPEGHYATRDGKWLLVVPY
jgi:hypothetical protein